MKKVQKTRKRVQKQSEPNNELPPLSNLAWLSIMAGHIAAGKSLT